MHADYNYVNLIIFRNDYDTYDALEKVLEYVDNTKKSEYIGAQNILLHNPMEQARAVDKFFYNQTKKKVFHLALSFDEDDFISAYTLFEEGYNICALLPEYQIVFAVHQNTDYLHMHFAIIPINLITGRKLCFDNNTLYSFVQQIREIFKKYDIKVDVKWN